MAKNRGKKSAVRKIIAALVPVVVGIVLTILKAGKDDPSAQPSKAPSSQELADERGGSGVSPRNGEPVFPTSSPPATTIHAGDGSVNTIGSHNSVVFSQGSSARENNLR